MADDSSPPTAKKPRTDGADFVTLLLKDSAGGTRGMTISRSTVPRVPYLETMLSTGLGAQQDAAATRQINLPEGCTASAAAALLLRVDGFGGRFAETHLACGNMDAAIELLRTADFLMMKEMIPAAVLQCHRNLGAAEDLVKLMSIESASVEVQQMRQTLTGGALVTAMGSDEVCAMVEVMRKSSDLTGVQASTLVKWLGVGGRTTKEINAVLSKKSMETTTEYSLVSDFSSFFFTRKVESDGKGGIVQLALKPGATQLLAELGHSLARMPVSNWTSGYDRFTIESVLLWAVPEEEIGGRIFKFKDHYYASNALDEYLNAFVTPFHSTTSDRLLGILTPLLCRKRVDGNRHLMVLLDRPEPFSLNSVVLVFPKLLECEDYVAAFKVMVNSMKEAHLFQVECLTAKPATGRVPRPPSKHISGMAPFVTVQMLSCLEADLQAKLVANLMPHLTTVSYRAVSQEVREYIENALASGDL